jgi:hypothetical protein
MEGDCKEDRIIVYCGDRSLGACISGIAIVPIYSRQFDKKGNYAEYVEFAKSSNKFIIVQTLQIKDNKKNYWIISKDFNIGNCDEINCDSIIQSHVYGPFEINEFQEKTSELKINLKFSNT